MKSLWAKKGTKLKAKANKMSVHVGKYNQTALSLHEVPVWFREKP